MKTSNGLRTVALVLLAAGIAGADGTIDTTGATLTPGAAPTAGVVSMDACAAPAAPPAIPRVPFLGTLDPLPVPVELFPDAGTGADGAFAPTVGASLPGGTYDYTSFDVPAGVTITYEAAVILLVDGDMTIDGAIDTDTVGAGITIVCSGGFTLGEFGDIRGRQGQSPVHIDVGTDFVSLATPQGQECTIAGNPGVFLRTHGLVQDTGDVTLGALSVSAGSANGTIQAARNVTANGASFNASSADLSLSAFGGDIDVTDFRMNIGDANGITVAASGSATFRGSSNINTRTGFIRVSAHGGDVTFTDGAGTNTATGPTDFEAAQSVILADSARSNTSTGNISLTAFGGDVFVGRPGVSGSVRLNTSTGNLTLRASGDVGLTDSANLNTSTGDHILNAGGEVLLDGDFVDLNQSNGRIELLGGFAVRARFSDIDADLELLVAAGGGGIDIDALGSASTNAGPARFLGDGDVRVRGSYDAEGAFTIVSVNGNVDVQGASFSTGYTPTGEVPSDVTLTSFAGSSATVDARNATIDTGAGDDESGGISMKVHAQTALQPKSVALVLPGTRRRPQLKVRGWVDIGPEGGDLAGPATFGLGTTLVPLVLESKGNGRRFEHRDEIVKFRLAPPRSGSTRAAFSLTLTADLTGVVDPDAPLDLRLATGRAIGRATVALGGGRFRLGKAPGTLSRPGAYLERLAVRLKGGGKDSLRLIAGYAAPSPAPTVAPDVTIEIGANLAAMITGDQFTPKGSRFVFKGNVNGITNVTVDARRGRVVVRGKNLDYGTVAEGPTPLRVVLGVGAEQNTIHVGAVRTRKALVY